jgi:hypothetical protein
MSEAGSFTCRLVLAANGTLFISDLGNGNATVWSNELLANKTTLTGEASCTPYSLAVLSTGTLVEKDCANRTVWVAPPLAGGAQLFALVADAAARCMLETPTIECQQASHAISAVRLLQLWGLFPAPAPTALHLSA